MTFTTAHFHVTTAQFVINCTLKYALTVDIRRGATSNNRSTNSRRCHWQTAGKVGKDRCNGGTGRTAGANDSVYQSTVVTPAETELAVYLQADIIQTTVSPTAWRAANAACFLTLANEAKCYVSAPPTSVASKRLFNSAALINTDRRSCLLPKWADMLLFVVWGRSTATPL